MTESPEAQAASYLKSAAIQRRYLEPRRHDRRVISQGGQVLHVVDTDIVVLYASPWEVAPHTLHRNIGYAEVFPEEEKDVVIAIGTALADYVFHKLTGELPLIMLPPLGEEMQSVFNAISHNAEIETQEMETRVRDMRQLLKHAEADQADATDYLAENAARIAAFLRGKEGALTELRRYGNLLQGRRIAPPDYLLEQGMISDPDWRAALEAPHTITERIRFHEMRERWFNLLKAEKSSVAPNINLEVDANVLARLEWINQILDDRRPPGDRREHRYMVLITGDRAMFAAAKKYRRQNQELSFADRYLRHPRAYLAEPDVLNPPDIGATLINRTEYDNQFDQWLDTFLGEFDPGTRDFLSRLNDKIIQASPSELINTVKPLMDTRPNLLKDFKERWRAYTHHLVIDHSPTTLERELLDPSVRKVKERYEALTEQLEDAIDRRVQETWEKCFYAVTEGSFALVSPRSYPQRSRNAPRLTFDRFKRTEAFIQKVLARFRPGQLSSADWDYELQEVRKDDSTGYAFYLAYGYLFAAEGIWRVAAILANRALTIAQRNLSKEVTGREAAFLRAVALRHSAHRIRDLGAVEEMLDFAERAYKKDLQGYLDLKAGPCRFSSERLALYLTYHLYCLRVNPKSFPDHVPDLIQLKLQIERALEALQTSSELDSIKLYTQHNLLVNWLMLAFLSMWKTGLSPNHDDFNFHYEELLRNLERTNQDFPPSFYVEAIKRCASWVTASSDGKHRAKEDLRKHFAGEAIENNSVMPYDRDRFQLLLDLVDGKTQSSKVI